jgi:hypothetical protein
MAWQAPIAPGSWPGFAWSKITPAFVNQFLYAAMQRRNTLAELAGTSTASYQPIEAGANLQSYWQINALRPRDTVDGGLHALVLAGGYARNFAGDTAAEVGGSADWVHVDGDELAVGEDWGMDDHRLWTSGAGFTSYFLAKVNAVLTGWGLDPMGSSLGTGGGGEKLIPWTRKYGDRSAPDVAYGEMQEGDIIGEWIFNEWRAVLEVLRAVEVPVTQDAVPDTWEHWEGTTSGEASCADAKSGAGSNYEDARTRTVSPVTDPPSAVIQHGRAQVAHLQRGSGGILSSGQVHGGEGVAQDIGRKGYPRCPPHLPQAGPG